MGLRLDQLINYTRMGSKDLQGRHCFKGLTIQLWICMKIPNCDYMYGHDVSNSQDVSERTRRFQFVLPYMISFLIILKLT